MKPQDRDPHRSGKDSISSREIGLAMGLQVGRHFLGIEHLHYGYWPEDLTVDIHNVAQAQAFYTEELLKDIPPGVASILDVGCGTGATALRLLEEGYRVDCVSQKGPLADLARENLDGRATLIECAFQEYESTRCYDMVLFSESLLFIRPLSVALTQALSMLREGGFLLVSDLFRRLPVEDDDPLGTSSYHRGAIGGGHYLWEFREAVSAFPLELVRETDITEHIAPTFAVLEQALGAVQPAYDLWMDRLRLRRPRLLKLGRWFLRLDKYEAKWFGDRYSADNFIRDKTYRRFLYRVAMA